MTVFWTIILVVVVLVGVLSLAGGLTWIERRVLALFQDRFGPNRAGWFGLLQPLADMIKMFFKEDWVPGFSDKPVFVVTPAIVVVTTLLAVAIVPWSPGVVVADINVGLLFFLGMSSLGVYSVALGAWSSNNKFALIGSMRTVGQMVSYEVFMGLSLMGVVIQTGSFRMDAIVEAQRNLWLCVPQCLGAIVFFIAILAETRRILRPARSGERTGRGVSHGVFGHEIRHVFHRRIHRDHHGVAADGDAVLRRVSRAFPAAVPLAGNEKRRADRADSPDPRSLTASAL